MRPMLGNYRDNISKKLNLEPSRKIYFNRFIGCRLSVVFSLEIKLLILLKNSFPVKSNDWITAAYFE